MKREEAIECIRGFMGQLTEGCREALMTAIPELHESEDERIRKQLINICNEWLGGGHSARPCLNDVRWLKNLLEKQEQNPAWSEEDEQFLLICKNALRKYQTSDHWDANIISNWLEERLKSLRPRPKEESVEEKIMNFFDAIGDCGFTQADILNLKSIWKECGLPSPQPHWKPSELEKAALRTAIYILTEERNFPKAAEQLQNILNAFEDKESRKDWKPSEEQMKALESAIDYLVTHTSTPGNVLLQSLCEDLKKL